MSSFLLHKPCSRCGSSDANGIYDDDHEYCFSCGYYKPSKIKSASQVAKLLQPKQEQVRGELPYDFTTAIPKEPYSWLKQYAITSEEISNNNIGWSDTNSMLIFPFYGEQDVLLCWQGRYFPARSPKVYTSGFPDNHTLLHHSSSRRSVRRVVVVEDSISAIKVSRVCDSSELLGSNLSMHKAVGLSRLYSHLTLWLDSDKLKSSIKFCEKYNTLFAEVDYIFTELDPKEYNTEQIKEFLCTHQT